MTRIAHTPDITRRRTAPQAGAYTASIPCMTIQLMRACVCSCCRGVSRGARRAFVSGRGAFVAGRVSGLRQAGTRVLGAVVGHWLLATGWVAGAVRSTYVARTTHQ